MALIGERFFPLCPFYAANTKGVRITMIGILITAYLVIGALVSALIWVILIASKRREDKVKRVNGRRSESNLIREPSTKPSRFQS